MELMGCPDRRETRFILTPDGRILCYDDDCYTVFGTWIRDTAAASTITPAGTEHIGPPS